MSSPTLNPQNSAMVWQGANMHLELTLEEKCSTFSTELKATLVATRTMAPENKNEMRQSIIEKIHASNESNLSDCEIGILLFGRLPESITKDGSNQEAFDRDPDLRSAHHEFDVSQKFPPKLTTLEILNKICIITGDIQLINKILEVKCSPDLKGETLELVQRLRDLRVVSDIEIGTLIFEQLDEFCIQNFSEQILNKVFNRTHDLLLMYEIIQLKHLKSDDPDFNEKSAKLAQKLWGFEVLNQFEINMILEVHLSDDFISKFKKEVENSHEKMFLEVLLANGITPTSYMQASSSEIMSVSEMLEELDSPSVYFTQGVNVHSVSSRETSYSALSQSSDELPEALNKWVPAGFPELSPGLINDLLILQGSTDTRKRKIMCKTRLCFLKLYDLNSSQSVHMNDSQLRMLLGGRAQTSIASWRNARLEVSSSEYNSKKTYKEKLALVFPETKTNHKRQRKGTVSPETKTNHKRQRKGTVSPGTGTNHKRQRRSSLKKFPLSSDG